MPLLRLLVVLLVCCPLNLQPGEAALPLLNASAQRLSQTPVLTPGSGWSSGGRFNPAVVRLNDRTVLLFRAADAASTSRIGYAESSDGLHFTVRPEPLLSPETAYEKDGGLEDPRVVRIDGTYYLTYTGYNKHDAQLCLATSPDLLHWTRHGVILPAYHGTWNRQWTKSGAIVPIKIKGKWWMYYLGTKTDADGKARDYMGVASSDDLLHWSDATKAPVLVRRPGLFDSRVMEPGPAPFVTEAGLLLLYNGADDHLVYGPGLILFDKNNPTKVIWRSTKPLLTPSLTWEKQGTVPNVIFIEGAIVKPGSTPHAMELTAYYGAADRYIGIADIKVSTSQVP